MAAVNADTFQREAEINEAFYKAMKDRLRDQYGSQYVGIAQGRFVAADPDFDKVIAIIRQLKPTPEHFMVYPADQEPLLETVCAYYRVVE